MKKSEFNLLVKVLTDGLNDRFEKVKFWEVNPDELRIETDTTYKWEFGTEIPTTVEINYYQTDTDRSTMKWQEVNVGGTLLEKRVKVNPKFPVNERAAGIYVTQYIKGLKVTKWLYVTVIDKLSPVTGQKEKYFVFDIDISVDNNRIASRIKDGMFLNPNNVNPMTDNDKGLTEPRLVRMVLA